MIQKNKFELISYYFLFALTILFISGFAQMSIVNYIKSQNQIYFIPLLAILIILIYLAIKISRISNLWFKLILIFSMAFIIRAIVAISFDSIPFNDFGVYLKSANQLSQGDVASIANYPYYKRFPDLLGFISWEALLIKIFGYNLTVLRLINCFISAGICVLIYIIGRKFNEIVGLTGSLIYSIYPSQIIMTSVFTNQHIATLLYLLAFVVIQYKIINGDRLKRNILWSIVSGALIGLANIVRPIAPPILLAILFYFIFSLLKNLNRKSLIKFSIVLLIPISYFIVGKVYSYGIYNYGLTKELNPPSDMRYKFAVGLDFESKGQYSDKIATEFWNGDETQRKELFDKAIKSSVKDPISFTKLVMDKMNSLFAVPDASYYWWSNQNINELKSIISQNPNAKYENETVQRLERYGLIYNDLEYSFYIIIYIMATIGTILIFVKNRSEFSKLMVWIFLGYVGAHCLIEIQARYRYFIMPFIIIFASYGMVYTCKYIKSKNILENIKNI